MRFLLDQGVSPRVVSALGSLGHDAVHVRTIGLAAASDEEIVATAVTEDRTIVTVDLDFAAIVASSGEHSPSIVTLRLGNITPTEMCQATLDAVTAAADRFEHGVLVSVTPRGLRIRKLPISE